mmetsp:Transcript_24011/g.59888  ORF Transcript_24011/g.59888 Transcript_24011/m.59888 type:complete len:250 (+) Transcript_24011:48-797(+)|eukprot:CAMPEP_0115477582 /NCGR_PEP_ID=MMETSP0271-20121206/55751_1 /TAXON_ID=71861 /ORGANISM="Scrippsiella trochoidea, Strain CCMP3099" /LENGTH=249 /DNA_ID=CAMNT_0002905079 /DNA_START=44 /DNA_END=793 /DNA_ORIENTATION=+
MTVCLKRREAPEPATQSKAKKGPAFEPVGSEDVVLEMAQTQPHIIEALKTARSALAQKGLGNGKVWPTSVATDAHLAFLAKHAPATIDDLRQVPGFGPAEGEPGDRVKHYGEVLLGALADARAGRAPEVTSAVKAEKAEANKVLIERAKASNPQMFEELKKARQAAAKAERERPGGNPKYPAYVVASDVDLARVALHEDSWSGDPATLEKLRSINGFGPATGELSTRARIAGPFFVEAINKARQIGRTE